MSSPQSIPTTCLGGNKSDSGIYTPDLYGKNNYHSIRLLGTHIFLTQTIFAPLKIVPPTGVLDECRPALCNLTPSRPDTPSFYLSPPVSPGVKPINLLHAAASLLSPRVGSKFLSFPLSSPIGCCHWRDSFSWGHRPLPTAPSLQLRPNKETNWGSLTMP